MGPTATNDSLEPVVPLVSNDLDDRKTKLASSAIAHDVLSRSSHDDESTSIDSSFCVNIPSGIQSQRGTSPMMKKEEGENVIPSNVGHLHLEAEVSKGMCISDNSNLGDVILNQLGTMNPACRPSANTEMVNCRIYMCVFIFKLYHKL